MEVRAIVVAYNIGLKIFAVYIRDLEKIVPVCGYERFEKLFKQKLEDAGWGRAVQIVGNVLLVSGENPDMRLWCVLNAKKTFPDSLRNNFIRIIGGQDMDPVWFRDHHELVNEEVMRMHSIFEGRLDCEFIWNRDRLGDLSFKKSLSHTVLLFEV
ncbi:MAG: hypothetical protein LBH44_03410 [Treponema sp.]|jgi:hypothetical protein|nr:hypothetical protein [Treponema sp.]